MHIRAVQTLTPSQATVFIFALKKILREMFDKQLQDAGMVRQFLEIESRIDRLGLAAFDVYMACREKIYELKANETRNRTFKAFERAGLIKKDPERFRMPDDLGSTTFRGVLADRFRPLKRSLSARC